MHQRLFWSVLSSMILSTAATGSRSFSSPNVPRAASNTTLPTFITSPFINSSRTNNDLQEPECLQQQGSGPYLMKPISIVHCYQLLTHLVARFSSSPVPWNTPNHPTPKLWTWGTCIISFDRTSLASWDVFSELQVAKAVASAVVKCGQAEPIWLGGRLPVWPRMEFVVAVYGRGEVGQGIGTT